MALDLKPLKMDLAAVKSGDTYPAIRFVETESDTAISTITMVVRDSAGVVKLSLSVGSGITVTVATAGAWDFSVGPITKEQTASLSEGAHSYEIDVLDSAGFNRTEFSGIWPIL